MMYGIPDQWEISYWKQGLWNIFSQRIHPGATPSGKNDRLKLWHHIHMWYLRILDSWFVNYWLNIEDLHLNMLGHYLCSRSATKRLASSSIISASGVSHRVRETFSSPWQGEISQHFQLEIFLLLGGLVDYNFNVNVKNKLGKWKKGKFKTWMLIA